MFLRQDERWTYTGERHACKHIVNIMDVYENMYGGHKCLLVVMEW